MRTDIQFFRGLAVFSVLLFHMNKNIIPNGYLGVDFFFVISGYLVLPMLFPLMTIPRVEGRKFLTNFLLRRFWRLAPTLLVTIFISTILMFLLAPINAHETFAFQALFTFALLGNFGASKLTPDYFNSYSNPLVHTWSLAVEEQFYIIVPVIVIVIRIVLRSWESNQQRLIFCFLSFLAVISFSLFIYSDFIFSFAGVESDELNANDNYYSLSHRFWQFMVGGLITLWTPRVEKSSSRFLQIMAMGLFLSIITFLFFPLPIDTTIATIYITFSSGLLLNLGIKEQIFSNWFLAMGGWLGNISYPLYLLHLPIIFLAKYSPMLSVGDGSTRRIPILLCVPVIFMLASIVHTRVEKKYRYANDK